ncbi:hypothetical protein NO559_13520 [Dasania sp. GY-MA-18]|uniref:Uncharacterized protein n=1 Tax=Dasania phycosphaerae TaxID=2950436 RepID=A0A9J6RQB6_9GAMM|nr:MULTISPECIES: hypothetical protein [Dasania]MCR8923795.1 hypothetical protein [Dasania sp. GY-MA-18]MCZ0866229.1 hypothetical protein [Dasania phycosphaerae]MCZ0869953.1 hypothetical protein [Dasania phycosphaerae]
MNEEGITEFFRKSINILFVSSPRGTSIGVLIGVILDGLLGLAYPLVKSIEFLNFSAIKMWHLIGLGVVSIHLPSYLRRKEVDQSILNAIKYIEDQKKNKSISDWQAKQMYFNLHNKVLESVTLNKDAQETTNSFNKFVTQPQSKEKSNK